ncbi:MAG TPA: ATPase [Candidatus Altiarchaeales archaeon]|nr:ATPase [Candidatus Altiarchaeales archaeon]
MDRIKSGVEGLDGMIEGGFVKNSSVLIGGGCGSGKSTFAMQFIYNGALAGEPGVYVSFEEEPEQIRTNMAGMGWDIEKLEKEKKIQILQVQPEDVMHIVKQEYGLISDAIQDLGAKRVVIDSVTSIEMLIQHEYERRQSILKLLKWLRKVDCTGILIAESEQDPIHYSRYGILEFVVDGVIVLYNIRRGKSRVRALEVLKMRGTNHHTNLVPYIIEQGITLKPTQPIFGALGGE